MHNNLYFAITKEQNSTILDNMHNLKTNFDKMLDICKQIGKELKDEYFLQSSLNMENQVVETEFQKHEAWKTKNQLLGNPTCFPNKGVQNTLME